MPIDPNELRTGGALQGAVAASLMRQRETAAELAPGDRVGAYRVVRELGRGGMAVVYLAERDDGEYRQQVALKWMPQAQPDAASEALFRRERQALADLRHPHIARLIDGGRSPEGRPWFAMELIQGEPLDRHCVQQQLPLARRLQLFGQVCAAVAFAHARGVIHRDIKPSNVLVDVDGSAKLLDFGIAQLLGEDETLAARACTPGFASPEQLRGEPLTVASDVYQLGRLLASLLSGDERERVTLALAEAAHLTAMTTLPQAAAVEGPRARWPAATPADLDAILRRATAPAPDERYPTAGALCDDVEAFLARRPVSARPRTSSYVAARYLQRHPVGVAAAIVVALLMLGSAAAFSLRLRAERDIAQQQRDLARHERDAAVAARAAADEARAAADAMNRFLHDDLLDAANPMRRAPGAAEITVREALAVAERSAATRFADQPALAAGLFATLGELRRNFGENEAALLLFERARAVATRLPEDHPERLRVDAGQALLLSGLQRHTDAIALLEPLVERARESLGPGHVRTLEWELNLLVARSREGADPQYRDDFEALAARADQALGDPNWVAGRARLLVAQSLRMGGAPEQGAEVAERAYAQLAATDGESSPSTLKALAVLAYGLQARGEYERAVETAKRAYELQKARFGVTGIDTLFLQGEYAFVLAAVDRHAEAESVYADLVDQRMRHWGATAIQVVPPLSNLAAVKLRLDRPREALADFERALSILDGMAQTPAPMRSIVMRGTADALRELKRYDEARRMLDAADAVAAGLPETDLRRLALRGSRARLLHATGDDAAATALLDEVIAAMRQQVNERNPMLKPLLAERAAMAEAASR